LPHVIGDEPGHDVERSAGRKADHDPHRALLRAAPRARRRRNRAASPRRSAGSIRLPERPRKRAQGIGPALFEEIGYDEEGNVFGGSFMDYYVPTAMECPSWETDRTITPSPHHPFGAKGVGESATVGAPPASNGEHRRV
jgi:hypothetical protein